MDTATLNVALFAAMDVMATRLVCHLATKGVRTTKEEIVTALSAGTPSASCEDPLMLPTQPLPSNPEPAAPRRVLTPALRRIELGTKTNAQLKEILKRIAPDAKMPTKKADLITEIVARHAAY